MFECMRFLNYISRSSSAEFLGSAWRDAAKVRHVGQPPQHRPDDVTRRQGKLRRRPADTTVPWRERGRGVLPGRGPEEPHAVRAPTSLPAQ